MRWLVLPALLSIVACEQAAPPSAPPKPSTPTPPPAPARTTTTAAPAPTAELQVGKALGLNPHPATVEPTKKEEPAAAPATEDPYIAAMVKAIEARKKNDPRSAEVAYRAALKAQPKDANALAGVAEMLFAQDKADEAVQPAELAYELKPTDPEVRWVFGLVMLSKNKRTEDATAAWEALIKDTPDYAKQLGVPDRLKIIKAYSKGPPHGGKKPPAGPSSAPAGGPSSAPAPK